MIPPPWQARSGEGGGLVPPHGRTKYKLSSHGVPLEELIFFYTSTQYLISTTATLSLSHHNHKLLEVGPFVSFICCVAP